MYSELERLCREELDKNIYYGFSPILLCRSSQALSGWLGSVAAQLFSGLSRSKTVRGPEHSGASYHGPLYFAPFIFSLILTSLPVPATEKQPHSMMLPPPCFTVGVVQTSSRCDAWDSDQRPNLGLIRLEDLVSHGLSPLGVFWQNPSGLSCAFY